MYQDIIASPLFFDNLSQIKTEDVLTIIKYLLTEKIIFDKDQIILKEYDAIIKEIEESNPNKELISSIIPLIGNTISVINVDAQITERDKPDFYFYSSEKTIKEKATSFWQLILYKNGANQYLSEGSSSNKLRNKKSIDKKEGDLFNFRQWIMKYLLDAKEITIEDNYIFVNKDNFADFLSLVKKLDTDQHILIRTDARKKSVNSYLYKKNYNQALEFNNVRIDSSYNSRDRKLVTEYFNILLGHSFGSINYEKDPRGYVEKKFTITFLD